MQNSQRIEILVIENNSNDTKLITNIIDTEDWKVNFNHLENSIEAMDYLHKKGKYKDCATPSLILLDLNLPEKSGLELLKYVKTDFFLKAIPVIILTNSNDDKYIMEFYENHANACIIKPIDYDEFIEYIYTFKEFWFNSALLP